MKKITLFISMILLMPSFASICHPQINPTLPQYIVGYGSLINEQSKKRTDETAQDNFPVLLKGYKRTWGIYGDFPGVNATFLIVLEDPSSSFNGVIYKLINPNKIQEYDKRESIYCRQAVSSDQLKQYAGILPNQKQIWIYSSRQKVIHPPSTQYPIVQSYVDLFIRGCIEMEEKFKIRHYARNCIITTGHWSSHWVNDRIFPRRPSLFEPYASKIDLLLKESLPEQFKKISIE